MVNMKKVVYLIAIIALTIIVSGCSVKKVQDLSNAEKFSKEFGITKDNPFVYTGIDTIFNAFNSTGLIFFANSDYEGSIKASEYITKVSKKVGVNRIYYYNPKKLEEKNPKKYKKLKKILNDDIKLPSLYAIKDGKIISRNTCFSDEKELSEEYLTKKKIKSIESNYSKVLKYEECSECH